MPGNLLLDPDEILDLGEEPRIDMGQVEDLAQRKAGAKSVSDVEDAIGPRLAQFALQRGHAGLAAQVELGRTQAVLAGFETAQGLLHRLLEGPPDRHDFADRLHLRGQARIGGRELLEGETRDLGHDIVDGRLERCRRQATGDLVAQLVEGVADRELGRHLGDRETGRLGGQCRRARHARIHLDDDDAAIVGIDAELDIGTTGIDADLAQHCDRGIAQALVFLVGQGLRRRNRDRVAGVHAHRIEVLDRADDDAVVRGVADDLHLELLPAEHRLLDEDLVDRRQVESALDDLLELLAIVGNAAPRTAEGETRPDNCGIADLGLRFERSFEAAHDLGLRALETDFTHGHAKQLAILGHADRLARRTDHLDAVSVEHAAIGQVERAVQRGLAAHGRQQRVGPLLGDDLLDHARVDRLDVDDVRRFRIGHDRRRIRVDQDDPIALVLERLAGLGPRIVELAGLADDDRARADDEDGAQISSFWHQTRLLGGCSR